MSQMPTQPDPDQLNELLERWQQMAEALRPVMEAVREAMLQLGRALSEALRPIIEAILEWWIAVKREALYRRLCRWHFPHRLARFLADRWPRRWLPVPDSVD